MNEKYFINLYLFIKCYPNLQMQKGKVQFNKCIKVHAGSFLSTSLKQHVIKSQHLKLTNACKLKCFCPHAFTNLLNSVQYDFWS